MRQAVSTKALSWVVTLAVAFGGLNSVAVSQDKNQSIAWETSYGYAMDLAKERQQMLFIYFYQPSEPQMEVLETWASKTQDFDKFAQQFVFCKVRTDQKVIADGQEFNLLKHEAFGEMLGQPGIAIIDCVDPESDQYGRVVSVYPVTGQRRITNEALTGLARLPRGTVTQRSLVLAVLLHRDRPRSVSGEWHPMLAEESRSHSDHQANIRVQGHHNWGHRFQRIIGRLGGGLRAQEVCAESWPGQSLMDAAEECVSSWRHSPGHWNAVSSPQQAYAYDMKRGSNGIWYATGIFAH